MTEHIVRLPTFVQVSNKTRFSINLNQYRNTHFQILNKAKVIFAAQIADQISALPFFDKVALTYTLYPARVCDTNNVLSIADKFFCDALKDQGRISDDNCRIVIGSQFLFGHMDAADPRVEVRLHPH